MESNVTPWRVIESNMSYEDRWLRVRTDTCQTGQGRVIESYHVIENPEWVNILALTTTGQVVTVREYRHGAGQILRGLPGGVVETWDQSPLAAIQRELLEETGYGGGQFFEIGHSYPNASNQNNILWSFLAINVVQSQTQRLDETENIEIVLQDFGDFSRQAWNGEIPLQALYLATLGLAEHFILRSKLPPLDAIRRMFCG
jgi:8-oxo-dGTP pyrophosphatase MutT (NUDIX family)